VTREPMRCRNDGAGLVERSFLEDLLD